MQCYINNLFLPAVCPKRDGGFQYIICINGNKIHIFNINYFKEKLKLFCVYRVIPGLHWLFYKLLGSISFPANLDIEH
jgi:hypothetical protein